MQLLYVLDTIELSVPGTHNVLNALACISLSIEYGISISDIKVALSKFTGAHRRFEYKGKIDKKASVYDDYGHHPTEIKATANSLKNKKYHESWVIFQPHTYSRTISLLDEFAEAFYSADKVIITDIYAAREDDPGTVHSRDLVEKLQHNNVDAIYISQFEDIVKYLKENVKENDVVITTGAGPIYLVGEELIKEN